MRYIHRIYTADLGRRRENAEMLPLFEDCIAELPVEDEERTRLRDFVRFQLVGERSRRSVVEDWKELDSFQRRAGAFETGAAEALDRLCEEIVADARAAGVVFDAVITTTATGNLMPGLSYRAAHRLGDRVRRDTLMFDLANVGCTGSSKALALVRSLAAEVRHVLLLAVEVPSTLADLRSTDPGAWQGNCTFGDGAAALWISGDSELGPEALALEDLRYTQRSDTGLDLIRWAYRDYYTFALADEKTFDRDVREFVAETLSEAEADWKDEPRWAIHPAGILLLMRLSRKLGIPQEAIKPSVAHYREHSNMSSASVLHVLKQVAAETPPGSAINLLTMGAGFNVVYGRVRRVR
ncbi:MAG: hypothetical protein ACK47B_06535 [Armatimonadota bacterium]